MTRTKSFSPFTAGLAAASMILALASPVLADDASHSCHGSSQQQPHHAAPTVSGGELPGLEIPSIPVVTQDGRRVDFRDLVGDDVVAMSFIFTTCTTICPPIGANFGRLRKLLGEDSGVRLISVSVDPVTDTPERLRAWGEVFGGGGEDWTLVTGRKTDITRLLKSLQVFTPDIREHSATVILGNAAADRWTRADGLAGATTLSEILGELSADS